MEATRLQMQNFLIFLLDLVGVTVGYFAAVWLRFGNIETGYTVMGNDTYYRWLIAIVVLMMIYFLFRPNRGFFKSQIYRRNENESADGHSDGSRNGDGRISDPGCRRLLQIYLYLYFWVWLCMDADHTSSLSEVLVIKKKESFLCKKDDDHHNE